MKKLSYIIGCLFLMLFVWVSCDNEDNRMQTTGYLELGVSKKCGSGHTWFRCQGPIFGSGYLYRSE